MDNGHNVDVTYFWKKKKKGEKNILLLFLEQLPTRPLADTAPAESTQ